MAADITNLKIRNLEIAFESKDQTMKALENVSFDVRKNEFLGIVGPSGCGKTTLLNAIGGLLPLTSGKISYQGFDLKDIGFVFQDPTLLPWRSIIDNAILPLEIRQKENKERFYGKAREMLKLVGLEKFENAYPQELSGGMKQRVSIARALISDPLILLMDEPFGALDEITRNKMNAELNRIWKETNKTIIFVTHSVPEAVFLSQRVIVLSQSPGTVKEIVEINLPETRDMEVLKSKEYLEHLIQIRKILYA